jgi:hydroxymethylglutaryl-CoA synthase
MRAFVRDAGVAGVVNDLGLTVGNAGTAHPGLLLADVLDRADPGQVIALVVLADGATAMILRTTDAVALPSGGPTLAAQVAEGHHRSLRYAAFLAWRGFFTREPPRRPDPAGPAAPPSFRPQGYNLDSWAIVVPNVGHCICPQSGSVLNAKPSTRWCRLPCPVPLGR